MRCGQLPVQMSFLNVLQELGALLSPVGRGPDGWGFVRTLLLFHGGWVFFFFFWPGATWGLSSPNRDGTTPPTLEGKLLSTGP